MTTTQQILDYIETHARKSGRQQAVKDLQTGLNLLNKASGNKETKIEIDGKYGTQTHSCLDDACKHYPVQEIKNKIKTAAISNIKYVWRCGGGNACDECMALDGVEFDSLDDVPDHPHPNCQCIVEPIEDDECDCWDEMDELAAELEGITSELEDLASEAETEMNDIEDIVSEAENIVSQMDETLAELEPEVGKHLPDCEFNVDADYGEIYAKRNELLMLIRDIVSLLMPFQTFIVATYNLVSNYLELLATSGNMDKYYHSVANCQNAQLGILGSAVSEATCNLKEAYDEHTYIHTHKVSKEDAIKDSMADQAANRLGRERGREFPDCNCRILMQDLKPPNPTEPTIENFINNILNLILGKFKL